MGEQQTLRAGLALENENIENLEHCVVRLRTKKNYLTLHTLKFINKEGGSCVNKKRLHILYVRILFFYLHSEYVFLLHKFMRLSK